MGASIRALQTLRDHVDVLSRERFLPEHVRTQLLEQCRVSGAILLQNIDTRELVKAQAVFEEIARKC